MAVVGHEVHVAGAHADAQHEMLRVCDPAIVEFARLLHGYRRVESVARGIEHCHDPVAGALDDRSMMLRHCVAQEAIESAGHAIGGVVADRGSLAVEPTKSQNSTVAVVTRPAGIRTSCHHRAKVAGRAVTGTGDSAGYACVYLASNEASWISGQTIGLNDVGVLERKLMRMPRPICCR